MGKRDIVGARKAKRQEKYFCEKYNISFISKKRFLEDKKEHDDAEKSTRMYFGGGDSGY